LAAGAVACVLLAGCGGNQVRIPSYDVAPAVRTACKALLDALPAEVAGLKRRTTEGSDLGTAWGDPAIVLRCGVGVPKEFGKLSSCQRANGVDWFVPDRIIEDQRDDVLMTTVGRSVDVEVRVPAKYRPSLAPMTDLAPAIKAHTTVVKPCQ
jgi:hypothetical protein